MSAGANTGGTFIVWKAAMMPALQFSAWFVDSGLAVEYVNCEKEEEIKC